MVDSAQIISKSTQDTVYVSLDPKTLESFSQPGDWSVALITGLLTLIAVLIPVASATLKRWAQKKELIRSLNNELLYNWDLLLEYHKGLNAALFEIMEFKLRHISNVPFKPECTLWKEISKEKHLDLLGTSFYDYSRIYNDIESIEAKSPLSFYLDFKLIEVEETIADPGTKPINQIKFQHIIKLEELKMRILMIGKRLEQLEPKRTKRPYESE